MTRLSLLLSHPAHLMALGFGAGLSPLAPGTVGTLLAWFSYDTLLGTRPDLAVLGVLIAGLLVGAWACTITARHLQSPDPGAIVWDEILAYWLILWVATPVGAVEHLLLFTLFRYFDAAKPGPVKWADQVFKGTGLKGGFGIIFDDLVAAGCTLIAFAVWRHI
jgi:phosphatidylglycerophosphatase A